MSRFEIAIIDLMRDSLYLRMQTSCMLFFVAGHEIGYTIESVSGRGANI